MDAIKYLLKEHAKYRKMLTAVKKTGSDSAKRKKFTTLTKDLTHHEKMEQKVWYPFLKKNTKLATTIKHLVEEEKKADKAIKKIKKVKDEEQWEDKYLQLKKDVEHHAKEEETKLFPKVRRALDKPELTEIGTKMRKFKRKLDGAK